MGLWRSIQDWTRTIIGCGALLVITVVVGALAIAALLVFVDPNMLEIVGIKKLEGMKTDEEKKADKKNALVEFIKKVKPSQEFSRKSLGRPVGKIVAVSNDNLDALNGELPPDLVAQTPDEVDAVALIARSDRIVGVYNNRILFIPPVPPPDGPNAAKRAVISITVIDPERGDKIHASGDIFGPPPNFLAPGASPPAPESPRAQAIKYLTALPRKATGKIVLNIDATMEASDPIDPVLAKTVKLVKVRTHMKDHTIALEAGKAYVISMESDAFDPHLRLEDPLGKQVAAQRDGFGLRRARIAYTPTEAGTFRIYAASFDGKVGPYRLIVQEAD
jgi:hypothetical protein